MPEPVTLVGVGGGLIGLLAHLARRHFETAKEIVDILLGVILLALSLPIAALCAAMIKSSSKGPVLYKQVRAGRNGKLFTMYKLRTMHKDAESQSGAVWAGSNDSRVIPICRWMRRAHIDELPQLLNVIKGEMSLVGPRPERPEILEKLKHRYPAIDKRLAVRPGITGLAQISIGYDTDIKNYKRKLEADMEYIANRRWSLELSILGRTLGKFNDTTAH